MKRFLGFVKKGVPSYFQRLPDDAHLFGIPTIQILLFGFVVSMDLKNARIAFLDLSNDETQHKRYQIKFVHPVFFRRSETLLSYNDIDRVLRGNKIKAVNIFEKYFGRKQIEGSKATINIIADGSEPNMATLTTNYISAIVSDFNRELAATSIHSTPLVQPEVRMFYNPL
jgi:ABC-2 type transport system permease protein